MNHKLTHRDMTVFASIAKMRYLTASQISLLHFPNQRKARRRLRILYEAGYLKRFERPNLEAVGRGEYVYYLSAKGGKEVGENTNRFRRHRKSLQIIEHHLLINDFRICTGIACQGSEFFCGFIAEYDRSDNNGNRLAKKTTDWVVIPETKERIRFTPDAAFYIGNSEGKKLLFFLEVDRGTENVRASGKNKGFAERIRAYKLYIESKGYRRYCKEFEYDFKGFRLLIVTNIPHRLKELKKIATEVDPRGFVWLCLQQDVTCGTVFSTIWHMAKPDDEELHSIVNKNTVKTEDS